MKQHTKFDILANICRIGIALVFIFSGFVKTIDPWGTAIKVTEYLNAFGFETLNQYRFGFSIWLCGAELMMGFMLLCRVRTPLISIFAIISLTIFLILTFIIAMWGRVEDCGCFGDALKLTNWQSFIKNLILWPMTFVVWWHARKGHIWPISRMEYITTLVIMCFAFGLGAYCYRHLPLIDFLPYKVGVNLRAAVESEHNDTDEAMLVCRNIKTGEKRTFSSSDTTWYDTSTWEFIDRDEHTATSDDMSLREFRVFDPSGDVTRTILDNPGRVYIVSVIKLDRLRPSCEKRLAELVREVRSAGGNIVCITSTPIQNRADISFDGDHTFIPLYNVDATTMLTMLRAKSGLVVLDNGVIAGKYNCRDIRPHKLLKQGR